MKNSYLSINLERKDRNDLDIFVVRNNDILICRRKN